MSKWVQHKSGVGEKWKLRDCAYNDQDHKTWVLEPNFSIASNFMELPRSEYIEVSPPVVWEDVTDWFNPPDLTFTSHIGSGCEIRKVPVNFVGPGKQNGCEKGTAFIIEKRQL